MLEVDLSFVVSSYNWGLGQIADHALRNKAASGPSP